MSANARAIVLALAALCVFGGTLAMVASNAVGGGAAIIVGLFIAISVAFEGRYGRPGLPPTAASIDWQPTGEKFIDDETGEPIEVFNHGKHTRDFTYIHDIVEGVIRTLDRVPAGDPAFDPMNPSPASSAAPYRVYNIGHHQPIELAHWLEVLEAKLEPRQFDRS